MSFRHALLHVFGIFWGPKISHGGHKWKPHKWQATAGILEGQTSMLRSQQRTRVRRKLWKSLSIVICCSHCICYPMSHLTETYLLTNNFPINFKLSLFCFFYFCPHSTVLRTYPWFCAQGSYLVFQGIWMLMLELTVCKANALTPILSSSPKFFSFSLPQWSHISIYYYYIFPFIAEKAEPFALYLAHSLGFIGDVYISPLPGSSRAWCRDLASLADMQSTVRQASWGLSDDE